MKTFEDVKKSFNNIDFEILMASLLEAETDFHKFTGL